MRCFLRSLLFVSCVCSVLTRGNAAEKGLARNDKDQEHLLYKMEHELRNERRHLNDDTRDEDETAHTSNDERTQSGGEEVGSNRHDEDSHGSSEEDHRDDRSEGTDENHRSGQRYEKNDREKQDAELEEEHMARGKNCDGAHDRKKGRKPRHLRAHADREGMPECKDEEDGFGLPMILGISGGALIAIFAFAAIVVWCYRRRISKKPVAGAVGVVVVGQPVTDSAPKDESNTKGNSL